MAIQTQLPTHTGSESGATIKDAMQSDIKLLEDTFNDLFGVGSFDILVNAITTNKINLPDGAITSAATLGGTAQTLAAAIALGKEADLAGVDFALKDGSRDLLRVHATKGLQGMAGNINAPLVHIPMKRANDALRLSGVETYTRSTIATYIDPLDGLLKTAAINEPVYERCSDGIIRQRFEPSATNFVVSSSKLNTTLAASNPANVTIANSTTNDMYGASSACVTYATSAATNVYAANVAALQPNSIYTFSVYVKGLSGSGQVGLWFLDGSGNATVSDVSTHDISDGKWGRCSLKITTNANFTSTTNQFFYISMPAGVTIVTDCWQVEQGTIASSYYPTTAGALTRAADSPLTIPVSGNFPTLDFTKDFCVVVDYESPRVDSLADGVVSNIFEVIGVQNIIMRHGAGWANSAKIYVGTNNGLSIPRAISTANQAHRFALVNRNGTMEAWFDNRLVGTGASIAITGTPLSIAIGNYDYLRIGEVRIYDFAPTNAELGAI